MGLGEGNCLLGPFAALSFEAQKARNIDFIRFLGLQMHKMTFFMWQSVQKHRTYTDLVGKQFSYASGVHRNETSTFCMFKPFAGRTALLIEIFLYGSTSDSATSPDLVQSKVYDD